MKPLCEFNQRNKETYFNLLVHGLIDEIRDKANEWVNETFISENSPMRNKFLVDNLKRSLDYLFTKAIWLIESAESQGFNMKSAKEFLESDYKKYTENEHGYRLLVTNRLYDYRENRLLSEEEATEREKRVNKAANSILQKFFDKEKNLDK